MMIIIIIMITITPVHPILSDSPVLNSNNSFPPAIINGRRNKPMTIRKPSIFCVNNE